MKAQQTGIQRISASAGSGKTYSLTKLYMAKALAQPGNFKGMVAITFTNKAAEELKERILLNLHKISLGDEKMSGLVKEMGFSLEEARAHAKNTLAAILHDFDAFQITTIDAFFQRIFSGLSYEMNIPQGLQPDLDRELIKEEVLEMGLRQIDTDTQSILLENILELLAEKGKGWRPAQYLESELLENLFLDKVIDFQLQQGPEGLTGERILSAKDTLLNHAKDWEGQIRAAAASLISTIDRLGFSPAELDPVEDATFLKERLVLEGIALRNDPLKEPSGSLKGGDFYRKPKTKKKEWISFQTEIEAAILHYCRCMEAAPDINLARQLAKHLTAIRLLLYFRNILQQRNSQVQRYLLQEVKFVLKNLVKDNDVPYVFEKLGTRIHTLMIDEFQDTDKTQWQVILPLAQAILDNGGFFAVVGDVKQSIYAWRGADSTLFRSGIDKDLFPLEVKEEILPTNFRSEERIVAFNNWVFDQLPERLAKGAVDAQIVIPQMEWQQLFLLNYQGHAQKPDSKRQPGNGFVDFRLRPHKMVEEEEELPSFHWLIPEIIRLQDTGIPGSDICILVRKNSDIQSVVHLLDQATAIYPNYDFRFSTAADLQANSHPLFRFLFLALVSLSEPEEGYFLEMESLAGSLGLPERFQLSFEKEQPKWRNQWLEAGNENPPGVLSISQRLNVAIRFFGLIDFPQHHFALVQCKNLWYQYQNEGVANYGSLKDWWDKKGGKSSLALPDEKQGIQIMTIHKSKGLDFGVVILAITSTGQSDKWHDFIFWPPTEAEPWNAFPLMQAKGKKEFLKSSVAASFCQEVYVRVLEAVNTWYVAFTRPRYGLIVDISINNAWLSEKENAGRNARLGYLLPKLLQESKAFLTEKFPGSLLEESSGNIFLRFQWGKIQAVSNIEKVDADSGLSHFSVPSAIPALPWRKMKKQNVEGKRGDLMHLILEKVTGDLDWISQMEILKKEYHLPQEEVRVMKENFEKLFSLPQIMDWFSDAYVSYPEQEIRDHLGEIFRVDRLMKGPEGWVILDFKTGQREKKHENQVETYGQLFSAQLKEKCRAFLVYTASAEILEVKLNH